MKPKPIARQEYDYKFIQFIGVGTIGLPKASPSLIASGKNTYSINNVVDYYLNTAWIEGNTSYGIGEYFINKRDGKYLNAKYEIINGDVLNFEIVAVYKGEKYKNVAILEFLFEEAGN